MTTPPAAGWKRHLLIFLSTAALSATGGTTLLIRLTPPLMLNLAHQAVSSGVGSGARVADNTLVTVPFIASPETANGSAWLLGGNQDTLYTVGWLDLSKGPCLLTVPDMGSRYRNVELVAPRTGVAIANLKAAGTTFLTAAGDATPAPTGTVNLAAPGKQVLVLGRTLVVDEGDLPEALAFARQITVRCQPSLKRQGGGGEPRVDRRAVLP
jgi:hypothetical protein